jgi:hypothetical protein
MRHLWKATLAALSLTAFAGLAGCAPGYYDAGYYGDGYGPDGVYYDYASGGYCDAWGCPSDFYDMPVYYGSVYYGGSWFNGPHYYRDRNGRREYWVHGGWHNDDWRGARPNWYRPGRTGPALGRDFYRSERFRNESRRDRGGVNNRGARPGFQRDGNRGGRNAAPQSQAAPQAQPNNGGPAFRNGRFLPRSDSNAGNRGGGPRSSGGDHGGGNRGGGGRGGRSR